MKKVLFIFALFLYFIVSGFDISYAETKDAIDIKEEKCLNLAQSNADMRNCTYSAMDARFNEINMYTNLIRKALLSDAEKLKKFEMSQIKWNEYQKTEFDIINTLIHNKGGTIYTVMAVGYKYEIVKRRASNLKQYYRQIAEPF